MISRPVQTGFSLIELIVVVVLLGVLAAGGGLLVLRPIVAYDNIVRRQQLVDQGELALRQIARDVRRALPNSIRIAPVGAGFALELVTTVDGARYRDENQLGLGTGLEVLDFAAGDTDFNLLGSFNSLTGFGANQRLVIYNTSAATLYADAASNSNPGIVTPSTATLNLSVSATYPDEAHINIAGLAPPGFQFAQQSPGQRLFVVEPPTSYICDPATDRIQRHTGYGFNTLQPTAPGGTSDAVVTQLAVCQMSYALGTAQRGGILTIEITLADGGESVTLLHQIHVDNVP